MAQPQSDTHEAIFQRWKASNNQLARSIQDYVEACAALEAFLATPSRDMISRNIQNKTFVDLDPELSSLPSHEERLQEVRSRLNETRNSSQLIAPINNLPPEILAMIFSLAVRLWINEDYQHAESYEISHVSELSGVCRLWRRLVLQCHTFWSELHLSLTGPLSNAHYERAELWAERSQNAPLTIGAREGRVQEDDNEFSLGEPLWDDLEISRAVTFLSPLMPRVRALKIYTKKRPADKFICTLLSCWIQHGTIGMAKELEIRVNADLPELKLPEISPGVPDDKSLDPQTLRSFLDSLQEIHLQHVAINWGHLTYSGLTEIRIEFAFESGWFPSQRDIANLLVANPELQLLILYGLRVRRQRGATPAPVAVNRLKVLGLETMDVKDIGLVLPLITSTSDAVRVSLSLVDDPKYISAARSFFARTKVTVLHVDGSLPISNPTISALFVHMPHLHTLALQACDLSESVLQDLVHRRASRNKLLDFWPALQQLYVMQCRTNPQVLRRLVDIHTPRKLLLHESQRDRDEGYGNEHARIELQEELSRRGVELVWYDYQGYKPIQWTFVYS
ncbi:hypothetical protein FRC09_018815 [Ceratobasidium sp. 395]|nr:hypothetical protein FRC09_018815 [Ceratobasidium sp. 395]